MTLGIKNIVNRYVCPLASLPTFDSLMSNNEATARDMRAACRTTGEEITRRAEWQAMYKSFTVASGESSVALPDDFHRLIQGNAVAFNGSPYTPLPYIRAADVWSFVSDFPSSQPYFSIKQNVILFLPALTASVRIRYISKNWAYNGSTEIDELTSDDDIPLFSAQLMGLGILFRYKRAKGLAYQDLAEEFEARLEAEIKADRGLT